MKIKKNDSVCVFFKLKFYQKLIDNIVIYLKGLNFIDDYL